MPFLRNQINKEWNNCQWHATLIVVMAGYSTCMGQMNDTLLRQWAMLRSIPRHPRKIDASSLQARLADAGFVVTLRSIQCDLIKLSTEFPLVCDGAKPQGWSWHSSADQLNIPALEPNAALTFKLVENYLRPILPTNTLAQLQPWFRSASGVLNSTSGIGIASWPEKVRVLPKGFQLQPPVINEQVQAQLYQALLQEKRAFVRYRPRYRSGHKEYIINPLALVVRDQTIYLLCTFWDYKDVIKLALHRVENVQLLGEPATQVDGFDLDEYIKSGSFGYLLGDEALTLEAEFTRQGANHLRECPLSDDQTITIIDEDTVLLRATVPNTEELRWWLRGFGDSVKVLGPSWLRDEFKQAASRLLNRYSEASG